MQVFSIEDTTELILSSMKMLDGHWSSYQLPTRYFAHKVAVSPERFPGIVGHLIQARQDR